MRPEWQDRTPDARRPIPQQRRSSASQWTWLAVTALSSCIALAAVILRRLEPAVIAAGIALVAAIMLLAGAGRNQEEPERHVSTKSPWWRFGKSPDDPRAEDAEPPDRRPRPSRTDEGPGPRPQPGPRPANHGQVRDPDPVPDADWGADWGTAPPMSHSPDRLTPRAPGKPVSVMSEVAVGQAYSFPDPPVFSGRSAPGQAPWHLPVGAAPSGLAADAARLGDLEVRAASMVGAGHRCQEPAGPRQDAYALGRTQDGQYLIIAVADGVSQSPRSDLGARVAVSTATRELGAMLEVGGMPAIDVERLYNVVAGEMAGTGRSRGVPEEDICSILIVAVIPTAPRADGRRTIWTSWIGDVSLWIHHRGDLHRVTGTEKTGLDRNTLTAVLPFNPDRVEQDTFELHPSDRVAVVTDGLSDSLSGVSGASEFFARQWANSAPHPAAFLHSLCYDGPGQTDDRTAVVVWCGLGGSPGPGDAGWQT